MRGEAMPTWAVTIETLDGPTLMEADAASAEEAALIIRELILSPHFPSSFLPVFGTGWWNRLEEVSKPKGNIPHVIHDREMFCRTCDRLIEMTVACKQPCACRDCYYFRGLRDVIDRMQAREQVR
jgi:hypothetical protein